MPESPGWGYTISDNPSARLSSVYIVISELDMLIWWHELSMLLIHHCISALADNLIYPQISLVLFLMSWWQYHIRDEIIKPRKSIAWLGVNTEWCLKIYHGKLGMFLFGDMNHLHTHQSCDLDYSNAKLVFPIF